MSINELQRNSCFTDVLTVHKIINRIVVSLMEYFVSRVLWLLTSEIARVEKHAPCSVQWVFREETIQVCNFTNLGQSFSTSGLLTFWFQ